MRRCRKHIHNYYKVFSFIERFKKYLRFDFYTDLRTSKAT